MKKFLLFLTLFLSAVGIASAEVQTISSNFTDKNLTVGTGELGWTASIDAAGFETASPSRGVQFGAKKGNFTLTSKATISNLKKIVLVLSSNATSNTLNSIKVGETTIPSSSKTLSKSNNTEYTFSYSGESNISGSIVIAFSDNASSIWIKSIAITYDDAGTSGGDKITTTLSFPEASYSAKLGEDFSTPTPTLTGAPETATISWESSNTAVANIDANTGAIALVAAGSTTITASYVGDDTHASASASFTLNVVDPNAPVIEFNFAEIFGTDSNVEFVNGTKEIDGASITCKDGTTKTQYYYSDNTLRLYTNGTITVAAPKGYYVTKIVFTSADWAISCDATNGVLSSKTWTYTEGKTTSNSVTFKATAKTFFKTITVYCAKDSNLKDAEFVFADTTVDKWIDDAAFTNTLNYAEGITDGIVYSIANPEDVTVAEINPSTGEVTIKSVGTATITATRAEDTTFKKGEASYTLVVSKHPHGLAYTPSSISLTPGEELAEQPTLKNDNTLVVTYSSSNESVATVTDDGTISLAGATGQAVISATFAGSDIYEAGAATFTIIVRDQVYADATYTLVKDVNTIEAGDVVVIAASGKVMSNAYKDGNRPAIAGNFSSDKTYLYGAANVLRLKVLKTADGYFMFQTENYEDTNGFLGSTNSTSNNALKVLEGSSDYTMATVTITEAGVATIKFNKGDKPDTNGNRNNLRLNGDLFNCYGNSNYTAVSIYKATSHPTTIFVKSNITQSFVETPAGKNNEVKLTYQILTESTVEKFAIVINGVTTDVVSNVENIIDIALTGVPYLPDAKITICPVLAEDAEGNPTTLGHPEEINFTWADINSYGLVDLGPSLVWIGSDADPLPATATLGANCNFGLNIPAATANLNYYVDVEAKNESTGEAYEGEFSWTELGFCYSINPYITGVPVDTETKSLKLGDYTGGFPKITCYVTPIYKFDVAEQYRSLITPATPRPARVASTITDGVQTVVCDVKDAQVNLGVGSQVSGVEGVTVDGGAAVEYFNLQGVRVDGDLAPGIYIRRQGQSVSKVQIR